MNRIRLIISGDVVGVGYRSWARSTAKSLKLTGWVKNREDRTVELVAEGPEESLRRLIMVCKKGPDVAWVKTIDTKWLRATHEFLDFAVLY